MHAAGAPGFGRPCAIFPFVARQDCATQIFLIDGGGDGTGYGGMIGLIRRLFQSSAAPASAPVPAPAKDPRMAVTSHVPAPAPVPPAARRAAGPAVPNRPLLFPSAPIRPGALQSGADDAWSDIPSMGAMTGRPAASAAPGRGNGPAAQARTMADVAMAVSLRADSAPHGAPPRAIGGAKWIGPGRTVWVHGFEIPGMVYVGSGMPANPREGGDPTPRGSSILRRLSPQPPQARHIRRWDTGPVIPRCRRNAGTRTSGGFPKAGRPAAT